MKRPSFFEDIIRSDRGLTVCLFIVMIVCISVVIHVVPIPTRAGMEQSLETFILESMAMAANSPEEMEVADDIEEEISEEETLEDFDELLSSFMDMSLSEPSLSDIESSVQPTELDIQTDLDLNFDTSDRQGELGSGVIDLNADLFAQSSRGTGTSLRPNLVSGFTRSRDTQLSDGTGNISSDELTVREDHSSNSVVLDSVYHGLDRSTLTPEEAAYEDAVVLRMKNGNGKYPDPVIRSIFDMKTTDLAFKKDINLDNQPWTVQISYSPVNRTLRIALVQDNTLFYFIDPGLQNRANYFEKGNARHNADDQVIVVESEEFSSQSPEAIRVFNLFLSWWKNELKNDG